MTAFREVQLPITNVRATDFVKFSGDHYQVLQFQRVNKLGAITQGIPLRIEPSNNAICELQKWNMNTDEAISCRPVWVEFEITQPLSVLIEVAP